MHPRKLVFAASIALALLPLRAAWAADNLESVLRKLDAAAANFHTTSAEVEFVTVTTQPIYDKDVQKGATYYKREGSSFQMGGAHQRSERQAGAQGCGSVRRDPQAL